MKPAKWTFGAEHEWGDIPRNEPLPEGFGWDARDCTIVNSNGIANDPKGKLYGFGGEINTPPTNTMQGQCDLLEELVQRYPMAAVNYRSNLHLHIRVPGLGDDLRLLKHLAQYNAHWLPRVLPVIEPIPVPTIGQYPNAVALRGAMRRHKRRKRSHQTVLPINRLALQLEAHTVGEFHAREVPGTAAGGVPMWHAQPRAAVNLRQLTQTDTIEFRHFPGTLNPAELRHCLEWCENYLLCALCPTWAKPEALDPWRTFKPREGFAKVLARFPAFAPYNHAQEIRYRATCHDGTLGKAQIASNIKAILDGSFVDAEWEARLKW